MPVSSLKMPIQWHLNLCLPKIRVLYPSHAFMHAQLLSCVWLFATPWSVACQAPKSMGFPRQEHGSGLPFPSQGDLPDPGIKLASLMSPTLAGGFFTTGSPRKPTPYSNWYKKFTVIHSHSILNTRYLSNQSYDKLFWKDGEGRR